MSIDWKRVLKGAAGVTVAAALCVAGTGTAVAAGQAAFPEDGVTAAAGTGAPYSVSAVNAGEFKTALEQCTANSGPVTITVTGDLALTTNDVTTSNRDVYCDLTIVSDGTDHTVTWSGGGSMLWPGRPDGLQTTGSLTVGSLDNANANRLTFTAPSPGAVSGPLFHPQEGATLTINGGTYTGLTSKSGNVVYNDAKTVINGGTFTGNTNVTGVVYQRWDSSSLIVNGGVFEDNSQVPAGNQNREGAAKSCADIDDYANTDACRGSLENAGGGAIHTDAGALTIQGDVEFKGNSTRAWGWMSGGGAVYAKGTLRIRNIVRGGTVETPLFERNWAADKNPWNSDGTRVKQLSRGGAGGAVFLQSGSKAYLMGGTFTDNTSGYLGGGIYTEEGTTSWVARSLATGNTAGHFGGGLWFCPSGSSQASEGGNIALYDNTVDVDIDGNTDNDPGKAPDGQTTMAGADFAIMNPAFKNHRDTQFQLMDTWFTDRANPAVSWQWDNQPLRMSGGYLDGWLPDTDSRRGISAVLATTKTEEKVTAGILKLTANGTEGDHVYTTGVALKAKVIDEKQKQQAESSAQVRITGNWSRLSGGGFGSNGVVLFSSPYSASWSKAAETTDGKPDKTKLLPGAVWTLSIKDGDITSENTGGEEKTPYMDEYMRTQACQPGNTTDGESQCWKHDTKNGVWTAVIRDDGALDNNKTAGVVGVDNLAPGTYTLTEKVAPAGYQVTKNVYTFKIEKGTAGLLPTTPHLSLKTDKDHDDGLGPLDADSNTIGNQPLIVAWQKVDADNREKLLPGAVWTVSREQSDSSIETDPGFSSAVEVEDCVIAKKSGGSLCPAGGDQDPVGGQFQLAGLTSGTYTLKETTSPSGYELNSKAVYTFTVPTADEVAQYSLDHNGAAYPVIRPTGPTGATDNGGITDGNIPNTQAPGVELSVRKTVKGGWPSGTKFTFQLDPESACAIFAGSNKCTSLESLNKDNKTVFALSDIPMPTSCRLTTRISDQVKPCQVSIDNPNDGNDGTVSFDRISFEKLFKENNPFEDSGDANPLQNASSVTFTYVIKEIGANGDLGTGGVKDNIRYSKDIWTVAITVKNDNGVSSIGSVKYTPGADNESKPSNPHEASFINYSLISQLPFTGGRSGLDWLLLGGGIALAAALAALATGRVKRHEL